jgi:S-adenosylmethionine-diacylgycerolhomoserine-N-methlytransferase
MSSGDAESPGATHMDRIYRHQRHIYDLTRKYYLLGRDALIDGLCPPKNGSILEIGCGTARNLIHAARLYPDARLFGIDISPAMLDTARANIARAGLSDRISLAEGDASDFDSVALFGTVHFDRVFLSYTLSMIPAWEAALYSAAAVLAPGGRLELVDFGQQEQLPGAFRAALFGWLARFDVSPRANLARAVKDTAKRYAFDSSWMPKLRGYAWSAGIARPAN